MEGDRGHSRHRGPIGTAVLAHLEMRHRRFDGRDVAVARPQSPCPRWPSHTSRHLPGAPTYIARAAHRLTTSVYGRPRDRMSIVNARRAARRTPRYREASLQTGWSRPVADRRAIIPGRR